MHRLSLRQLVVVTLVLNLVFAAVLALPLWASGGQELWTAVVAPPHVCVQADVLTTCP